MVAKARAKASIVRRIKRILRDAVKTTENVWLEFIEDEEDWYVCSPPNMIWEFDELHDRALEICEEIGISEYDECHDFWDKVTEALDYSYRRVIIDYRIDEERLREVVREAMKRPKPQTPNPSTL